MLILIEKTKTRIISTETQNGDKSLKKFLSNSINFHRFKSKTSDFRLNPLMENQSFLYPLQTSENRMLSYVFRGYKIWHRTLMGQKDHDPGKASCLYWNVLAKLSPRTKKLYQITYIFCNPHWSLFIDPFDTNLLARSGTLGLQWICRTQLFIQTIRLHCSLLWNYIRSLLAYSRG